MYMCLDSQKLYYDQDSVTRTIYNYQGVKTVNDLMHNITPSLNTTYYCWEDNSLWLWMNKWITLWTDKTYPSAYVYENYPSPGSPSSLNPVYRNDEPLWPADDNGLLKDGSVVVRDRNRIIKGKLYIDDGNDNLVISSYLGGGLRLLPNGHLDTDGEFFIGDEGTSFIRSKLLHLNNETYVDYTEAPELDNNPYKNDTHRYMIYHEGNIDAAALKVLTPQELYQKLLDTKLPNPLQFNVAKLNGLTSDEYAKTEHTHLAEDITDFNDKAQSQASLVLKNAFANVDAKGLTASYEALTQKLLLDVNDFTITLSGGVVGSGTVKDLTDTAIKVTVDPNAHKHQNYLDIMQDLQDQIDVLARLNPNNYYTRTQTDALLQGITPTDTPIPGKALKVDTNGILPGTALATTKFEDPITINFTKDITGTVTTDFSASPINIELDAGGILTTTAQPGKGIKVNDDGDLPVNATTSSALNHNITVNLTGDVTGSSILDTSLNKFDLKTTLVLPDTVLTKEDLDDLIPGLDKDGKIDVDRLPDIAVGLDHRGVWDPSTGAPSSDPIEGLIWSASANGDFNGETYQKGDWCAYINNEWTYISTNRNTVSVNGKDGIVTLTYSDVDAISDELIDYSLGSEIPQGKVVRTSQNGIIEGVKVDALTNEFNLLSDTVGDVIFHSDSTNVKTDGTTDLDVKMMITEDGYQNIIDNTARVIKNSNDVELDYKKGLKFSKDFIVTNVNDNTEISLNTIPNDFAMIYWQKNVNDEDVVNTIDALFDDRSNKPLMILGSIDEGHAIWIIDSKFTDRTTNNIDGTLYLYEKDPTVDWVITYEGITLELDSTKNLTGGYINQTGTCTSTRPIILNEDTDSDGTPDINIDSDGDGTADTNVITATDRAINDIWKAWSDALSTNITATTKKTNEELVNEILTTLQLVDSNATVIYNDPSSTITNTKVVNINLTLKFENQVLTDIYTSNKYLSDIGGSSSSANLKSYSLVTAACKIGDELTISHNLNSLTIITQFRQVKTGQECFIDNYVIDNNTIKIAPTQFDIETGEIKVTILALD